MRHFLLTTTSVLSLLTARALGHIPSYKQNVNARSHMKRILSAQDRIHFGRSSASDDALLDLNVDLDIDVSLGSDHWLKRNCAFFGFYPDDGDKTHNSEGVLENPKDLNKAIGTPVKFFGVYAHIQGDQYVKGQPQTYFDGRELLQWIPMLEGTGATAVLSIMPVYGWGGLNDSDNTQALETVKVLKKFLDSGIEVYLRFGHEMNWYITPGSDDAHSGLSYYAGGPKEYIEGWKTMARAVKDSVPQVKMFWSPNIGSPEAYAAFWPGKETVDLVGVDYYPRGTYDDLASHVQNIHDTYALANDIPFHMGETGDTGNQTIKENWIRTITSKETCTKLPKLEAVHWFNFEKDGGDFRAVQPDGQGMTASFRKIMACGTC